MPKALYFLATLAYPTGFSAQVLKNNYPSKVVNIILDITNNAAFILSKSSVDWSDSKAT